MKYVKHFAKYFIPGKHNQYKPHFFRLAPVLVTASVITLLFLTAVALDSLVIRSGSSLISAVVSSTLVELTNVDRESNNLHGLAVSPILQQAAQMKANDMAAKSYFSHDSPEGLTPWHWFEAAGYSFSFAGENLAVYFSDSAQLERAWMNSPLHRANILNSYFTEIGIATAKGVYQGRETVYVVQEFGRPSKRIASAVVKKADIFPVENVTVPTTTGKLALKETKKESPAVKGAATEVKPLEILNKTDTFIAVKNGKETEGGTSTLAAGEESMPLGEVALAGTSAPAILKIAASPWTLLRTVYSILAVFIVLALLLMIGIEIKRQHPLHIFYGVALLALMAMLLYSWQGYLFGKLLVL
jgi:uncharacterized protein YkwD